MAIVTHLVRLVPGCALAALKWLASRLAGGCAVRLRITLDYESVPGPKEG